jgi:uncharacterized membrane protein YkoI
MEEDEMRTMSLLAAAGVAGLVAASTAAPAGEERIELARVPAVVKAAATKAAPGVTWEKASKETEDGKTSYEVEGKNAAGKAVSVSATEAGKVEEVETEITLADVPAVVTQALKARRPNFDAEEVVSVARDCKIVAYEFEGDEGKKEYEVSVSADGKDVKATEEKEEDDDKEDDKGRI